MEKLIKEVRQHPSLWDSSTKEYKDARQKKTSWLLIEEKLNKPANILRRDWKKLRDCFRQALARRTGRSEYPEWRYEKQMQFLLPVLSKRKTSMNLNEDFGKWRFDLEVDDTPLNDEDYSNVPVLEANVVFTEQSPDSIDINPTSPQWDHEKLDDLSLQTENLKEDQPLTRVQWETSQPDESRQVKRKCDESPPDLDKLIDFIKQKDRNPKEQSVRKSDSLDLFFASACMSTRNLPRKLQASVKRQILDIIDKAEEEAEQMLFSTDNEKSNGYSTKVDDTINDGTIHITNNGEVLLKQLF